MQPSSESGMQKDQSRWAHASSKCRYHRQLRRPLALMTTRLLRSYSGSVSWPCNALLLLLQVKIKLEATLQWPRQIVTLLSMMTK